MGDARVARREKNHLDEGKKRNKILINLSRHVTLEKSNH